MNIIKFRGQTIGGDRKGEWVYGSLVENMERLYRVDQIENHCYIFNSYNRYDIAITSIGIDEYLVEVDPKTVGQYIGLKDKDGKEIYEGDIYVIHGYIEDESDYEDKHVIAYEEFSDCCVNGIGYSFGKHGSPASIEQIEVIGNIYENEDLLTKKI